MIAILLKQKPNPTKTSMRRSQKNFRWLPIRNQKSSLFTGFHKHSTVWPRRMLPVNQETSGPPPLFECLNPTPQPRKGNLAIKPTAFSKADRWKERCVMPSIPKQHRVWVRQWNQLFQSRHQGRLSAWCGKQWLKQDPHFRKDLEPQN